MTTPRHLRKPSPSEPRLRGLELLQARVPDWATLSTGELRRRLCSCQPGERSELRRAFNAATATDEIKHSVSLSPPPHPAAKKPTKPRAKKAKE